MKQTIVGVFNSEQQAELALKEISFDRLANEEISILKIKQQFEKENDDIAPNSLTSTKPFKNLQGFTIQGANFEITDLGETFIAGPLADRIKNSTAQNLTAALISYGVTKEEAKEYENLAKKGKTLLVIETNSVKASNVVNIMSEYGGKSVNRWNKNLNHSLKVFKSP